jgi:protease-4
VTFDSVKTGKFADFETISRPKTTEELAIAQSRVDDLYHKFVGKVADSRNLPEPTVESIAQGRVWPGQEALGLHLVDEIGGLDDAITYAAGQAKLGASYRVKEYPEEVSLSDTLAQLLTNQQSPPLSQTKTDPLTAQFLQFKAALKSLKHFNDPLGAYARLPLGWEIK